MKALDIVRTPKGAIGMITETQERGQTASVASFGGGNPTGEKSAWWSEKDGLEVIDNLPRFLAYTTCHPHGIGRDDVSIFFPIKNNKTDE